MRKLLSEFGILFEENKLGIFMVSAAILVLLALAASYINTEVLNNTNHQISSEQAKE